MKTFFTVHAVAINSNNEYLVLQRANHRTDPGTWNCVTGYIQERESAEDAALRELKEETNLEGELLKTTEPFWVEINDTRWVVVASLIKVKNIAELKIDASESQAYKWITKNDPLTKQSQGLSKSMEKLNILG